MLYIQGPFTPRKRVANRRLPETFNIEFGGFRYVANVSPFAHRRLAKISLPNHTNNSGAAWVPAKPPLKTSKVGSPALFAPPSTSLPGARDERQRLPFGRDRLLPVQAGEAGIRASQRGVGAMALRGFFLTPAERNFVNALATYFNVSQYKKTDELVAWPAWETLISEWSLSKPTIWRAQRKLEQQGKLKVIHGGFNRSTGHKFGNKYRAVAPPPGFRLKRSQVSNTRFQPETRLDHRGLTNLETLRLQ